MQFQKDGERGGDRGQSGPSTVTKIFVRIKVHTKDSAVRKR